MVIVTQNVFPVLSSAPMGTVAWGIVLLSIFAAAFLTWHSSKPSEKKLKLVSFIATIFTGALLAGVMVTSTIERNQEFKDDTAKTVATIERDYGVTPVALTSEEEKVAKENFEKNITPRFAVKTSEGNAVCGVDVQKDRSYTTMCVRNNTQMLLEDVVSNS